DAGLPVGEQLGAELVGVVGSEQLALLALELHQVLRCPLQLDRTAAGDLVESALEVLFGPLSLGLGQGDLLVVALDGGFDRLDAVIRLGAGLRLGSGADDVLEAPAVATVPGVDQVAAAVGAVERAARVVAVAPAR